MAHRIQCIIGKETIIHELANNWVYAHKVDLNEGFSVIPLNEHLIEDINELTDIGDTLAHSVFTKINQPAWVRKF